MKAFVALALAGTAAVIIFDEAAGRGTLSKTLRGDVGGINLALVKEHGSLLAGFAFVLFLVYLASEQAAIGLGLIILLSMILLRGRA